MKVLHYFVDLHDLMGSGSYGSVYKGYDQKTRTSVAAKQIKINKEENENNKSALQEIQLLMDVKHKNIVQLLDVCEYPTCWWLMLEFCDHGDLNAFLKSKNPDITTKIGIMIESAAGLSYMHNLKPPIVHRDLAPKNILVKASYSGPIVKICDFGLSRTVETPEGIMSTDTGTLTYRAPEFFNKPLGILQYTSSVDTFALGLVFKVMLDYGCEGLLLDPTVEMEGNEKWMYTYGMTLDRFKKEDKKNPVLFFVRSAESNLMVQLKCLIANMTAYSSEARPNMEDVTTILTQLRHGDMNAMMRQLEELNSQLEERENRIISAEKRYVDQQIAMREEIDQLTSNVQEKENVIEELEARHTDEQNALKGQITKINIELQEKEKLIDALHARNARNMDIMMLKVKQEKQKSEDLTKQNQQLKERYDEQQIALSEEIDQLTSNVQEKETAIEELEARYTDQQITVREEINQERYNEIEELEERVFPIVCALEIGTELSGFAFGFWKSRGEIYMKKREGPYRQTYKWPSAVLSRGGDKCNSFGKDAENDFLEFTSDAGGSQCHLFRNISLSALGQQCTTKTEAVSTDGYKIPALIIFGFAIKCLKDHMMEYLGERVSVVPSEDMIQWVISIPENCTSSMHQFVTESALQAGLKAENFLLVKEPDAVTYYIQKLTQESRAKVTADDPYSQLDIPDATRFLFVKIEGTTTEISAHETLSRNRIRAMPQSSILQVGWTNIDNNFCKLLSDVMGIRSINSYRSEYFKQLSYLINTFHDNLRSNWGKELCLELTYGVAKSFEKVTGIDIQKLIQQHSDKGLRLFKSRLMLDNMCVRNMVQPVTSLIVSHLKAIIEASEQYAIITVDTDGRCAAILQEELEHICSEKGIQVIVPEEPHLAVLKGSVQYGLDSKLTASHIVRHSYVISTKSNFNLSVDSLSNSTPENDSDVFKVLTSQGDSLRYGWKVFKTFTLTGQSQQPASFGIFSIDVHGLPEIQYVSRSHFKRVGMLNLYLPHNRQAGDTEVVVEIFFAGTEFWITVTHEATGTSAETTVSVKQ